MRTKKLLSIVFDGVMGFIIAATLIIGAIQTIRFITDQQILEVSYIVGIMFITYLISRRIDKHLQSAYREIHLYMLDEARIRDTLYDWSRNKLTTKEALQQIDSIYSYHYTDTIQIKDGDKR